MADLLELYAAIVDKATGILCEYQEGKLTLDQAYNKLLEVYISPAHACTLLIMANFFAQQ